MKTKTEFYEELEKTLHERISKDHPLVKELFRSKDTS
jgi:hypothetical protein